MSKGGVGSTIFFLSPFCYLQTFGNLAIRHHEAFSFHPYQNLAYDRELVDLPMPRMKEGYSFVPTTAFPAYIAG